MAALVVLLAGITGERYRPAGHHIWVFYCLTVILSFKNIENREDFQKGSQI